MKLRCVHEGTVYDNTKIHVSASCVVHKMITSGIVLYYGVDKNLMGRDGVHKGFRVNQIWAIDTKRDFVEE